MRFRQWEEHIQRHTSQQNRTVWIDIFLKIFNRNTPEAQPGCFMDHLWVQEKTLLDFGRRNGGNINSEKCDLCVLSQIQEFMDENPGLTFMQDNAPSHRSRLTRANLHRRGITTRVWPRYSPDLNLIEHVWNWMNNWIQDHCWEVRYDPLRMALDESRRITWAAWEEVPESFLKSLVDRLVG